jgi:predicted  nucleic acid-binding Zn-ribbon protein
MAWFVNSYQCYRCNHEWDDLWSATSDDDCPACGARHVSPYESNDVPPKLSAIHRASAHKIRQA